MYTRALTFENYLATAGIVIERQSVFVHAGKLFVNQQKRSVNYYSQQGGIQRILLALQTHRYGAPAPTISEPLSMLSSYSPSSPETRIRSNPQVLGFRANLKPKPQVLGFRPRSKYLRAGLGDSRSLFPLRKVSSASILGFY